MTSDRMTGDYEQICKLKPFPFKNGARRPAVLVVAALLCCILSRCEVGHGRSLEPHTRWCLTGTKDMDGAEMLAGSIARLATTSDSRLIAIAACVDTCRGIAPVSSAEPSIEPLRSVSLGRLRAASLATSNLPRGHWSSAISPSSTLGTRRSLKPKRPQGISAVRELPVCPG